MAGHQGALHRPFVRNKAVAGSFERRFGFSLAGALSFIGLVSLWRHGSHAIYWLGIGITFAVWATVWPAGLRPLNRVWLRFGLLLQAAMGPVVLAVIFFAVFTPAGVLMRGLGKDPLRLRRNQEARSYWIVRHPPGPAPESFTRQY